MELIVHDCDQCEFEKKVLSILAPTLKESMRCQVIRLQDCAGKVEIKEGNWSHFFSISKAGGGNFYREGDICFHFINTADKFPSKNLN